MKNPIIVKKSRSGSQKKPLVVVVGAKVARRAVDRNLLKRRVRDIMRPAVKDKKNDYTVITRPGAPALTFAELKELLIKELNIKR